MYLLSISKSTRQWAPPGVNELPGNNLFIYLSKYLCIYRSIYKESMNLSIYALYISIYLSKYLSIYPYIYRIYLLSTRRLGATRSQELPGNNLSIYLSKYLTIYPSIYCLFLSPEYNAIGRNQESMKYQVLIYPSIYLNIYVPIDIYIYICEYLGAPPGVNELPMNHLGIYLSK